MSDTSETPSTKSTRLSIDSPSDDNVAGVGLSNPQLSQPRRRMLDLVNRLHSTGVQVDIDLPQIAVIGSQSAGKSSLIESISGITLPRAAGTCTRCPTECRLSCTDTPWQCVISLRFITDKNGQLLGQARNELFGPTIFDKSQVEERIRRAQRAILNPSRSRKLFLDGEDEDLQTSELSFSNNCVSLQISGPDVADLSFCDLPGLIASVSSTRGSANDIALVESLVTSYIKKSSCIILLTVACETDFENQGAHRLAKTYDPEGKRTIGVLTKPDRIPVGEESNWLPFIRNEKEALDNNWYCVKQPSSNDIKQNITWVEARKREDEFFSMTAPWNELDSMYQKYLRTTNLVDRLSSILSDLISKRLPQIQEELEKSIFKARDSLNLLPREPSKNPLNEIATLLHVFTADLRRHVDGIPDEDGLLQAIRPAQERFRRAIRETAPDFRPYERKFAGKRCLGRPKFLAKEEGIDDIAVDEGVDDGGSSVDDNVNEEQARGQKRKYSEVDNAVYIDDVLERAHLARTRELPGNYPFVVQQTFIGNIIKQWRAPALVLLKTIHAILVTHSRNLVAKHFGEFGQGVLDQRIRTIVHKHLSNCLERAEEKLEWFIRLEDLPFSLNTHYLSDYRDKFLTFYKTAREKDEQSDIVSQIEKFAKTRTTGADQPASPNRQMVETVRRAGKVTHIQPSFLETTEPTGLAKVLAGLSEMGMVGIKPEDIPKLLPPDRMEPAIHIMADVRAYFQVAYKRFADNIPLAIDYELVRGAERDILKTLYAGLGINGPDGHRICKDLAQENPQIADKRADLLKKLERLQTASLELLNIGV